MALTIESPAFLNKGEIPTDNTCDGEDVSPGLQWNGVPSNAKSLALIVDDPDAPDPAAPKRTYVHWVLYDIPVSAKGLPPGGGAFQLPKGTREGKNEWGKTGYGGPCPPIGRHRYFFKLYALDVALGDRGLVTKADLELLMQGHVIDKTELMGTYQRTKVTQKS
jgi:Raf kinase inhibitor-like YbhB/YbcL family protein